MSSKPTPLRFIGAVWTAWAETMLGPVSLFVSITVFICASVFTVLSETQWQRIVGGIVSVVALFVAMYRVWGRERSRVIEQEDRLTPKLKCSFDRAHECQHRTRLKVKEVNTGKTLSSTECRYFRLRIECIGVGSVPNCSGYLLTLRRDGRVLFQNEGLVLTIAPAEDANSIRREIRNGVPAYLDLFCVTEQNKVHIGTPQFVLPISVDPNTLFAGPGEYRFDVVLTAPPTVPIQFAVILKWTGDWQSAEAYAA